jgi:peptide/nickel transport system permease protein
MIDTSTTPSVQAAKAQRNVKGSSTWALTLRRFRRNTLAQIGGTFVLLLLLVTIFAPFFAPYNPEQTQLASVYVPPQRLHFIDTEGRFHLQPFTYPLIADMDPDTWERLYREDTTQMYPVRLFAPSWEYELFGVFKTNIHLIAPTEGGSMYLLGTDKMGRDLLSLIIFGARISVSIAVFGALVSAFLGAVIGAASGYYGGIFDTVTQRISELLLSFPTLPLFMAVSVAIPVEWPPLGVFFGIMMIFALLGWPVLAREVRGKVLSYREEEFVAAAHAAGASGPYIIFRHILPNVISHIIVILTISVPELILAEGALSFLGLGIQPPLVSWGVLLRDATTLETLGQNPWIMLPGLAILLTVLAFNFLGDGLRDAVDATTR